MGHGPRFTADSAAVQTHLSILQAIIQRMAANSASCKGWCIALVSAVLVLVADKGEPDFALIALIPALLFPFLDTYYLDLERRFRDAYGAFVEQLHTGHLDSTSLYDVKPEKRRWAGFAACLLSVSVWPLYSALIGMILAVRELVIE